VGLGWYMTGIAGRSSFEWLLGNFLANKSHLKVMSPIWYKESNAINIGLVDVDLVRDHESARLTCGMPNQAESYSSTIQ
jgi:hypothetical protein